MEWILPEDSRTDDVLRWVAAHEFVDRLLMVVRLNRSGGAFRASEPGALANGLRLSGGNLLDLKLATAWPVTRLADHSALVIVNELTPMLIARMSQLEPTFFGWLHDHEPALPEDLCAFKTGAPMPSLVSTTHDLWGRIVSDKPVDLPGASVDVEEEDDLAEWVYDPGADFLRGARELEGGLKAVLNGRIRAKV